MSIETNEGVLPNEGKSDYDDSVPSSFNWWTVVLLLGGVIFVVVSNPLGKVFVQSCSSPGNCNWRPEDVEQAAQVLRCLGGMAFAAGLIERLISALTSK